jgi:type IV pilus assembly protein PilM
LTQGQKIKVLWEHLGLRDNTVVSSMALSSVIVKRVLFRAGSPKELDRKIHEQAGQYIPNDMKDVYLDYQALGQGDKKDAVEVMLVAGKKKSVEELIRVMDYAGISPGIIDVDVFALSNCFEFNYPELAGDSSCLVDIGETRSIFAIFRQSQPVFFREMSFGGSQLTDIISRSLDMSSMEAEELKINGPSSQDNLKHLETAKEIHSSIKSWAEEVKRLTGFYQASQNQEEEPKNIFLSGGGSLFRGIENVFQEHLGIETKHLDPWKGLEASINDFDYKYLDSIKPQLAIATGLALRSII